MRHRFHSAAFCRRHQDGLTPLTRRNWADSSTSIIPCHWTSGRFHTCRKRCKRPGRSHEQFLLTLHPLQTGCLQSKTDVIYGKADRLLSTFATLYNTLVRPHFEYAMQAARQTLLPTPIVCSKSISWRRGSVHCHIRNNYVGWVCTPYAGVVSVETS